MKVTRREFLKISGAAVATLPVLGFDLTPAMAQTGEYRIKNIKPVPTICPYCGCGCGLVVHTAADGKVINTEGDPDHPINQGATCAKGASVFQLHDNPRRMRKPLYRAPNSDLKVGQHLCSCARCFNCSTDTLCNMDRNNTVDTSP